MTLRIIIIFVFAVFSSNSLFAQDVSKDIEMGNEGYQMVAEQMGFYEHEELNDMLQCLGKKLEDALDEPLFDYKFYLVDSPEPNAFAIPGGKVFVTRGLLALPLTEGELAGVIGHEIIHANNRHGIKQRHGSIFGTILSIPGVIIGGIFHGPIGSAIASPFLISNELLQANYSRSHEKEADKYGTKLAANAGYDPYDLANILTRLSSEASLLTGQLEEENYFASHPYTPKRVKAITKYSDKWTRANYDPCQNHNQFLQSFDGLTIGQNPEYGFVSDGTFYHPKQLFSFQLDSDWETAITPQSFSIGSKDGDAILSFVAEEDSLNQKEYLNKFKEEMRKQVHIEPNRVEEFKWYGYKGGLIEYTSETNGGKVFFQMYALDYRDGKLFKIAALYKEKSKNKVDQLLRKAKVIERSDLPVTNVPTLRVIKALEGETLSDIWRRKQSPKEYELLMVLINDHAESHKFNDGDLVKVLVNEPFTF